MSDTLVKSSPKSSRAGRAKVKTGCRTCKVRRVKCDEGRPACQKCVSTGRKCDGYGIWGGGGTIHMHSTNGRLTLEHNPFPLFIDAPGEDEHCYFEWFRCRTSKKLPGPFESVFWESLVLRASFEEPAVLHAALALGSAHKKESLEGCSLSTGDVAPDDQEQFILRHYSRAIRHLQPHFASKSPASVRVALITCMVFVCLEYLRGRFQTGNEHLKNGLRLIGNIVGPDDVIDLDHPKEPTDLWLMETFAKLNIQANMLGQGERMRHKVVQTFDTTPWPVIFKTLSEARKRLDWLQSAISSLMSDWEQLQEQTPMEQPSVDWIIQQKKIMTELAQWDRIFKVSRVTLVASAGMLGQSGYILLRLYYHMACIQAGTCFLPQGETSYDAYTSQFIHILAEAVYLHEHIEMMSFKDTPFAHNHDISPFTSDKGWIPPLYFTATKCRVHRLRLQAVRLLKATTSKEGVWDCDLAAAIGGEVIRLEEANIYKNAPPDDSFAYNEIPEEHSIELPFLAEADRIHHTDVVLPNSRQDKMVIVCKRRTTPETIESITGVYDPVAKEWSNENVRNTG